MRILILILFFATIGFCDSLPLGTFAGLQGEDPTCPSGFTCRQFKVSCPAIPDALGVYSYRTATDARAAVILFSGGGGGSWWSSSDQHLPEFVTRLVDRHISVLQVKWNKNWLVSAPGVRAGPAKLACRPATVISYLYKKFRPATNHLIISGNSGGASQVSYPLAYYGLAPLVDVLIPTGGPPHSALQKSCMRKSKENLYWYNDDIRKFIDQGFGFFSISGPCSLHNKTFIQRWKQASVAYGGNDYTYPDTKVRLIIGENDFKMKAVSKDYVTRLTNSGTPVELQVVPKVGHNITSFAIGRKALFYAITKR